LTPEARLNEDPWQWPVFGTVDDVRPAMAEARSRSRTAVLATLYATEGAAPRGLGAQMLFVEGQPTGFLAGGCIEADVALHAEQVLLDGEPRRLAYGEGGPADLPLPCGSRIEVLVERIAPEDGAVTNLLGLTAARRPALWRSDGRRRTCTPVEEPAEAPDLVVRRYDPVRRLIVVGGEPIGLATARLAVQAGWEVVLVRPKGPQAPPPVDGLRYLPAEPADALADIALDPWTAVALLTHDTGADHEALVAALPSPAFYVGVLGSRRRLGERRARLKAAGVPEAAIARLHAPIGLNLNAEAPWEIAIAIFAEVIQASAAQRIAADTCGSAEAA